MFRYPDPVLSIALTGVRYRARDLPGPRTSSPKILHNRHPQHHCNPVDHHPFEEVKVPDAHIVREHRAVVLGHLDLSADALAPLVRPKHSRHLSPRGKALCVIWHPVPEGLKTVDFKGKID
jgi:hypothetical protein